MPIAISPYTQDMVPAVREMNARLAAGGADWKFYEDPRPSWLPPDPAAPGVWREYHVVTDGDAVRGGFVLKPQRYLLAGEEVWLTSWQGPVSEGIVNRRFAAVGMLCLREMHRLRRELFCWGGSDSLLKLLDAFGWEQRGTPLQIAVLNGGRFFREARVLRGSPLRRRLLDLAAATGLAGLAAGAFRTLRRPRLGGISTREVPALDSRADALWEETRSHYRCIAVRDSATVAALLPQDRWPDGTLIEVSRGDRLIGWGAIRVAGKSDDRRFGDMTVGSILDALALPGEEARVCAALVRVLKTRGPDMILTHMTHATWRTALRRAGFLELPNRRRFCATPDFVDRVGGDLDSFLDRVHLTPIDADGPHGL